MEQDGEKETLAALPAEPEREPLAKDSVEIEAISGPRTVTYTNDAINRLSMNDPNDGIPTNYARNHLNQYTSVTGHGSLSYDGERAVFPQRPVQPGLFAEWAWLMVSPRPESSEFSRVGWASRPPVLASCQNNL